MSYKKKFKILSLLLLFTVLLASNTVVAANKKTKSAHRNYDISLNNASGLITTIGEKSITISIKKLGENTQTKTINLSANTRINKDLQVIKINDLKIGDRVRVNLEKKGNSYIARNIRVMTANTINLIKANKLIKL